MKITLLCALAAPLFLTSCLVFPARERVVTVQEQAPVVYETTYRPGYTVTTLPTGYRTVNYNRNVYYENRGVYYRPARRGYVVVDRPY